MTAHPFGDRPRDGRPMSDGTSGGGSSVTAVAGWPGPRPLLADVVPVFERLGVRVADADAAPGDGAARYRLLLPPGTSAPTVLPALEEALTAAWAGETELDGLSRLTVTAGLPVAEVTVLRAACRFLVQARPGVTRSAVEETVVQAPDFARALLRHFTARHCPDRADEATATAAATELDALLAATTEPGAGPGAARSPRRAGRGGAHQCLPALAPRPAAGAQLALKIASRELDFLPAPRPWVETFVYCPAMEGLHLRGAPVARGGIRWSERPEDFRTRCSGCSRPSW